MLTDETRDYTQGNHFTLSNPEGTWGRPTSQIIDSVEKWLPAINTLAYWAKDLYERATKVRAANFLLLEFEL
jgi:hypothetical protein